MTSETMTTTPAIPARQLMTAWRLATRLGHEWTCIDPQAREWNVEDIRAFTLAQRTPGAVPGITAPHLQENGEIWHESATGRIVYVVFPDADAEIRICRRFSDGGEGSVITVGLSTDEHGCPFLRILDAQEGRYYLRHVAAIRPLLMALGQFSEVESIIRELRTRAANPLSVAESVTLEYLLLAVGQLVNGEYDEDAAAPWRARVMAAMAAFNWPADAPSSAEETTQEADDLSWCAPIR